MKPIEKISYNLFQNLRSRFSPLNMGDENAEVTTDPSDARFFSFIYVEDGEELGPVSISIINNRSLKIFYTNDMVEGMRDSNKWYDFLKELRFWAKQNLLAFDARDIQKDQLDSRDFKFLKTNDSPYQDDEVEITESAMFGSKKKSYQTFENAKLIVNHFVPVDDSVRGARSRKIESIFIENASGERFKFPYNYLGGARTMAVHISEGGTPYDEIGQYITDSVKEMKDLGRFARITRNIAMENEEAGGVRSVVVERYNKIKKGLTKLQKKKNYREFVENYQPEEILVDEDLDGLKEKFTVQVRKEEIDQLLPTVQRAMKMTSITEAAPAIENIVRNPKFFIVLKKDDNADRMFKSTKFNDGKTLLSFILSDVASRVMGEYSDEISNFASDMAERVGAEDSNFSGPKDAEYLNDKRLALLLGKKYIEDAKRISDDPEYKAQVRKDPTEVYGKKKKRDGGVHEQFEKWVDSVLLENELIASVNEGFSQWIDWNNPVFNAVMYRIQKSHPDVLEKYGFDKVVQVVNDNAEYVGDVEEIGSSDVSAWTKWVLDDLGHKIGEAAPVGTVGTKPTTPTTPMNADPNDPELKKKNQQALRNVDKVAKAAGLKTNPAQLAKGMQAAQLGKKADVNVQKTVTDLGTILAQKAAEDPRKAAQITALMRKFQQTESIDLLMTNLKKVGINESHDIWSRIVEMSELPSSKRVVEKKLKVRSDDFEDDADFNIDDDEEFIGDDVEEEVIESNGYNELLSVLRKNAGI